MSKTIEEKILEEFDEKIKELKQGVYECRSLDWYVKTKYPELEKILRSSLSSLCLSIISDIEGLVPKENKERGCDIGDAYYKDGFNSCRSQFLSKLKEYKEK